MNPVQSAIRYARYLLKAQNRHGIHSPFVYELSDTIFQNDGMYYDFHTIEYVRESMLKSGKKLAVVDLGAGSRSGNTSERNVSAIAGSAAVPPKYGQLLFRMVNLFKPATIVELGTSLGIGTMYMASARKSAAVHTIEGAPAIAQFASENFSACNLKNIHQHVGNFDSELPAVLENLDTVDFAYIDGNHREEPTLRYFEQLKAKANSNTVMVFDDIHWSDGMEAAWNTIKADPKVRVSLDVWRFGIVFFREELSKEAFVIRY